MIANDDLFWGTFWGQFTIEIVGGILSGLIFLFVVLIFFRPKVNISPFICRVFPSNGGAPYYCFKFVNRSYFAAHNVNVELRSLKRIPMGEGVFNEQSNELSLRKKHIMQVNRRPFKGRGDSVQSHCIVLGTDQDLNLLLADVHTSIELKISLTHGLTSLSNVFVAEYVHPTSVRDGQFKSGPKFELI